MVIGGFSVSGGGITDHGKLQGLSDDDHTQYAEIANSETITGTWDVSGGGIILPSGASAPGSPSDFQVYYDTTTNDDIPYYYDSSRSRWLSFESTYIQGLRSVSSLNAGYLNIASGLAYQAQLGLVMPRDFCVVAGGVKSAGNEAGDQMQIRSNGSSIATVSFNSFGDRTEGYASNLDGTGSAGDCLSLYINAGTNKMIGWAQIKWRH